MTMSGDAVVLNDAHSALNPTTVARVVRPDTVADVVDRYRATVRQANDALDRCTDLSDPVGNAIHPRIGDRPMLDALELRFVARA